MSDPGAVTFPLLELGLAGHRPGDEWFADAGKMHVIDCAWRRDDAGFDVPPRFPATGPQAFAANIAFVGFGGSCLWDWRAWKFGRRDSKFQRIRQEFKPQCFGV